MKVVFHKILVPTFLCVCLSSFAVGSSTVAPSNTDVVVPSYSTKGDTSSSGDSGTNPVFQLAGYVKDSFVRMKDGSVQLYTNHKKCNEIRSKQKEYLEKIASTLPKEEQKAAKKYYPSAGGITYEEFDFLQKGKEDRGRLANTVFMMVFAPNFVPYAFMFFPDMLPSSFSTPANKGMGFSKWDMISRERSHSVLQAMIDLERSARVAPILSNLNPFGKGKTKRMMERMDKLAHACGAVLSADGAVGSNGAELVMNILEDEIYSEAKPKKDRTSLTILPKSIVKGLGRAMDAPSSNSFLPTFLVRGKILNSLAQIQASDEFLVDQGIDLTTLSTDLLQEACSKRLIGVPGRTHEEMIDGLSSWLDLSVKEPSKKVAETGYHYNGNLARASLLTYNAVDAARDVRTSSFLPRLMYQGHLYSSTSNTSPSPSLVNEEPKNVMDKAKRGFFRKK